MSAKRDEEKYLFNGARSKKLMGWRQGDLKRGVVAEAV